MQQPEDLPFTQPNPVAELIYDQSLVRAEQQMDREWSRMLQRSLRQMERDARNGWSDPY